LGKPITSITDVKQHFQKGIAASYSIFDFLDLPEEVDKAKHSDA